MHDEQAAREVQGRSIQASIHTHSLTHGCLYVCTHVNIHNGVGVEIHAPQLSW